jgi:ERCC4-type nuclease
MHTITVDYRETALLHKIQAFLDIANSNLPNGAPPVPVTVATANLPLGDIIISGDRKLVSHHGDHDENPTVSVVAQKVIFERKTLQDLANSIRDGRYAEQSFRLNACVVPNHHVIYIVEGDLRSYRPYNKTSVDKRTLLSAMVSISYYKGFSLYRSLNLEETAEFILQMAAKIARRPNEKAYYGGEGPAPVPAAPLATPSAAVPSAPLATSAAVDGNPGYSAVHVPDRTVKKSNINPVNIGEIMLSQIPGVSTASAIVIMQRYKTVPALLVAMQEHPGTVFDDLYVTNRFQKRRRINKKCKTNLFSFLHGGYPPPKPSTGTSGGGEPAVESEEDSGHSDDSEEEREQAREDEYEREMEREREREEEREREREREEERLWRVREEETVAAVIAAVTANVPAFAAAVAAAAKAAATNKAAQAIAQAAMRVATEAAANAEAQAARMEAAEEARLQTANAFTAAATPAATSAPAAAPAAPVVKAKVPRKKKTDAAPAMPETAPSAPTTPTAPVKVRKPRVAKKKADTVDGANGVEG